MLKRARAFLKAFDEQIIKGGEKIQQDSKNKAQNLRRECKSYKRIAKRRGHNNQ